MTTEKLWDVLEPETSKKALIIKDLREGITPELPYFVVGQQDVKDKISQYIGEIDGKYFNRTLLVSDYGNGKTNILKYLELYFSNGNNSVTYIYEAANADKPNVFAMILELLEFRFKNEIKEAIKILIKNESFMNAELAKYTFIKEYIHRISEQNSDEELDALIYMGTGRYYTKKIFSDYNIPPLTDMHRKEVMIFFLNLLSENDIYILFAIDELEKIYEKSKARFRNFLTTFRELIDLSSKINGHYFISAMVTSVSNFKYALEENPAFKSRVEKDILKVEFLSLDEEKLELINKISKLLDKNVSNAEEKAILTSINTKFGKENLVRSNRYMIQEIFTLITNEVEYKDLKYILEKNELKYEFDDLKLELEVSGIFKRIKDKFIDGLRYYFNLKDQEIIQIQGYENLYSQKKTPIYRYFVLSEKQFNDDKEYLDGLLDDNKIVYIFYNQEQHNIKHDQFEKAVELVNYDIETLLSLFIFLEEEMQYREKIEEIIQHYTKGKL